MILVDTSVWVDHLRRGNGDLARLLDAWQVLMHPFVLGELACGNLQSRRELIRLWQDLPPIATVQDDEALYFIEQRQLMRRGIGFVDVHLLGAVLLMPTARIWTRDRRLAEVAGELGVGFSPE